MPLFGSEASECCVALQNFKVVNIPDISAGATATLDIDIKHTLLLIFFSNY